jgi:hypothetical protein
VTDVQERVLMALEAGGPMRPGLLASLIGRHIAATQHCLDALFRRSMVAMLDDGRYLITERGERKLA